MKPTYTLHKLPNGYVLTSDEEIERGYTILWNNKVKTAIDTSYVDSTKKVVAQDFDFSSLSPEDQKEIGCFDVEKISYDWLYDNEENMPKGYPLKPMEYGFQQGFQKAQELLSDRRFTLEDMRKALSESFKASQEGYNITSDEIIKSLLQKSWEVEVEMETLYLEEDSMNYTHEQDDVSGSKDFPKFTKGKIKILRLIK